MRTVLPWLALVACAPPAHTSTTQSALTSIVANGGFETGDYTGWTLSEDSGFPQNGTWTILGDGQAIVPNQNVFDFFDNAFVLETSPGLPILYHASEGSFVAAQLQNGPEDHRMFQTVAMPSCQPSLLWDMQYANHNGSFEPSSEYLAVNVRDPVTDQILATPFKTNAGDPLAIGMSSFQVDLTGFAGQVVRIDFELQIQGAPIDAAYDNIRVLCTGLVAQPPTLDFGAVSVGAPPPTQSSTITNMSIDPLTISTITIDEPFLLFTAPSLPLILQPGASTIVEVMFRPTAAGPVAGSLTITGDDPDGPTTIPLAGDGTIARIAFDPGFLDFGRVRLGVPVKRHTTITNLGTGVLVLSRISPSPPFQISGLTAPTVSPGESVDLEIALVAPQTGPITGSVVIESNDPAAPSVTVPLAGLASDLALATIPASVAFGPQRVATTSDVQVVALLNTGSDPLTIASVTADGPFVTPAVGGLVIPAGYFVPIEIQFAPVATGPASGSLTIVSDALDSPTIVPVTGIGVQAVLEITVPSLDFGSQRVGTTTTKSLAVRNTGDAPLAILSAVAPAPFAVTTLERTVLPGGQATLFVTFSPSAVGSALATAVVTTDVGVGFVALGGLAVQPSVSATPSTIDYGDVRVGATSAATTVAITNPGSDTLHITAIALPPGFKSTAVLSLPVAIAPSAALLFDVVFTPVAHASYPGMIAIASDAGTAAVAVTGRGVVPALVASLIQLDFGPVAIGASSPLAVQLSNPGDAPVAIASVSFTGALDYALTSALQPVIAPGTSATLTIAFTPSAHGPRGGTLTIASDAVPGPLSIDLLGAGSGPRAVVGPPGLDFGAANVSTTAPPRSVTVGNLGDAALVISAIVISGVNGSDVTAITPLPVTVAPGDSTTVAFSFAPSAVGARVATATLVTTDPLVPSTAVALKGIGTSPLLQVGPDHIDFGGVNLGRSLDKVFAVTNLGTGPLTITSITVGGTDAAVLSIAPFPVPLVIAPLSSAPLRATFAPTTVGTAVATVTVISDDATATITFAGTGTAPTVSVAPSDLEFGAQVVGHPSALQQLHISNTGSAPLSVTSLAVTGTQASRFALVSPPPLPVTIPAAGELVVSVRVTADATGVAAAALEIKTDATPATVSLAALGVAAGLSVSPATIDFGTTHPGTSPAPVTVTLTNLTSEPIRLVDAIRGGGRPDDFTISSVAGLLAPATSTTAVVAYTPPAATTSAATITFASTDTTIPHAIVSLGARAVSTFITADRDTLDFGAIEVGAASGAKTVSITNTTTAPLSLANIVSADPQFVATTPLTLGLAPGGTISFPVTFAPSAAAPASSTLAITLTGSSTPELIITVTGTGETTDNGGGCSTSHPSSIWLVLALLAARRRRRLAFSRSSAAQVIAADDQERDILHHHDRIARQLDGIRSAAAQGKLTTLTGTVPEGVVAPVLLITWVMTPLKLSDTVNRSWNSTPAALGTSKAWEALTAGLTLKKQ